MSYIYRFFIIFLHIFLLISCASKNINDDFKSFSKNNIEKINESKGFIKDEIVEINNNKKYLYLDNRKKLSTLLEELSSIDQNFYVLDLASRSFVVNGLKNSFRLNIDSFDKLKKYIEDSTNYTLIIKKNKYKKNRVKQVSVISKSSIKNSILDIPFSFDGEIKTAYDMLQEISKISKFNLIVKSSAKNPSSININDIRKVSYLKNLFQNSQMTLKGSNISNFLELFSKTFNVYIDVDYDSKTIIIQKLKYKVFHTVMSNIDYSGTLDASKSLSNDVGSVDTKNSIKSTIKLSILDNLEDNIKKILSFSSDKNSIIFTFDKITGQIFIKADKSSMNEVTQIINDFNSLYSRQIDFEFEIFEFEVKRDFNLNINLGSVIDIGQTTLGINSDPSNSIASKIFDFGSNKNSKNPTTTSSANINNNPVKFVKHTRHGYILKNNIPYFVDLTDVSSYIKNIETTTTEATDNQAQKKTRKVTISEVSDGIVLSVLPKILSNKVELTISPKLISADASSKQSFGDGDTITLPKLSVNTFRSNLLMGNGDKTIIGYATTYKNSKSYDGILPTQDIPLLGKSSKSSVRRELVFVVSVNIR